MNKRGKSLKIGVRGCVLAVAFLMLLSASKAFPCSYIIREVGFAMPRKSYHIYCLVRGSSPGEKHMAALFKAVSDEVLKESNVEAEVVEVDRQIPASMEAQLGSIDLNDLPKTILISHENKVLVLPKADYTSERSVRRQLEDVVSSPGREEIKRHIVRNWCVVMLVEGTDRTENERAEEAILRASQQIVGTVTEKGTMVKRKPYLMRLSPQEVDEERILLWSLGLPEGEGRRPRAVVLFGRGQRIGPVLEGERINERSMLSLLYTLGKACACTTDPKLLSGPQIPLRWEDEIQEEVCRELGFDPDNPLVRSSLAMLGLFVENPNACTREAGRRTVMDYIENPVEEIGGGEKEAPTIALPVSTSSEARDASSAQRSTLDALRSSLLTFGLIFLSVGMGTLFLWIKRRR